MKNFTVKINYSHESYNGYDHNDGDKEFTVSARNATSAEKKALKLAHEKGSPYEKRVVSVFLTK